MSEATLIVLLLAPVLAALACFLIRSTAFRTLIVTSTAGGLAVGSLLLQASPADGFGGMSPAIIARIISGGDFLLLSGMLFLGCRYRHSLIIILTAGQLALFTWLEIFVFSGTQSHALFRVDILSLVMLRVVCIVGGLICLHAIPYMQAHEEHQQPGRSRQPAFFAVLFLFLGAMNGLVLSNHLAHFYFFFELTTLCSFLLIIHDGTEEAVHNALTALWMNGLGGFLLLLAAWCFYVQGSSLDMNGLVGMATENSAAVLPLALLLLAAFIKSAQLPWQRWLLGAMVAPTPTSALLHSSTMVKAGVYLALRFAPALAGTVLGHGLMLTGGFTFFAAAALAIGQRNAKKVLAYSTISNLGLIFACAGIGTPGAVSAGILLILFHAVSKGVLFLCIGTAEQRLHSRDIEVMRGLCATMPFTGVIALLATLTFILPPFGMLVGKWMVFEAGADNIIFYLMLVLGSSCTLLYWVRLAGTLLTAGQTTGCDPEVKPFLTRLPMTALLCGAVILALCSPTLYAGLIAPLIPLFPSGQPFHAGRAGPPFSAQGPFPLATLFFIAAPVGLLALSGVRKARSWKRGRPYMAGANINLPDHFLGPVNRPVRAVVENYYLTPLFGEERWTPWINLAAAGLLLFVLGGVLWT